MTPTDLLAKLEEAECGSRELLVRGVPGGGEYGRGARRDVRNPILALPASVAIQALPIDQRRPLGILLRELAVQADHQANEAWRTRKGIMAAYWRAVSTYAKHLARVIDPAALRARSLPGGEK